MRGTVAKRLRKMAAAMVNPKYKERMYTVKKTETLGEKTKRVSHTFANAVDSARGIYQRLKRGGKL